MAEIPEHEIDEAERRRFEEAWARGRPVPIEECLPPAGSPSRSGTLEELVHIELELAWKRAAGTGAAEAGAAGDAPLVEDYLRRFPELDRPEIVRRLLATEYRVRQRHGDRPELESYRRRFPGLVETGEDVLDTLAAREAEDAAAAEARQGGPLAERYHLIAEHARGGFGAVWRARDENLRREVALKQLSPPLAERPEFRRRFVGEARITARLEHPGIVPIYDLADAEAGAAYYAMKLVRGETLAAAIARFHALAPDAPERPVEERRLLAAFLLVSQTMEYSHARGVVHRDLKPQNIVLGDYGETIVLDWGLAKAPADAEAPAGDAGAAGPDPPPSPVLTRPGTVQGTPAYMAPEQAAGEIDRVDERSDIYALGAILYQILTGRLPFDGPTAEEVLARVRAGRPPRPRAVRPEASPALEAICLKAMACEREQRYAAVSALARDLQRFLADEPVSVYREPWTRRAGRWMRRHRALVTGVAAATLVGLVGLAVVAVVLAVARDRLQASNESERAARAEAERRKGEAERERERAEANFEMARTAVDRYYTTVSEDPKLRTEGLESLRRDLLREAGKFYERFVAHRAEDREVERERGWAYLRLAAITADTGADREAIALLEQAREILAALAATQPGEGRHQVDLAQCENSIASRWLDLQDSERAEAHYRRALQHLDSVDAAEAEPLDVDYHRGRFLNNLAVLHDRAGRLDEAEASYRASLEIQKRLVGARPAERSYRHELAATWLNLGAVSGVLGRVAAREEAYREAIRLGEALIAEDPAEPDHADLLATARYQLGSHHAQAGQVEEALAQDSAALEAWRELSSRHPEVPDYLHKLAGARTSLGNLHRARGDPEAALAEHREALKLREALVARQPDVPVHRFALAGVHLNLGALHAGMGRLEDAEQALAKAAELDEALATAFPGETRYALEAAMASQACGEIVAATGRPEETRKRYDVAAELLDSVLQQSPQHAAARRQRRELAELRAELYETLSRHGDAAAEWARARDLAPAAPERERLEERRVRALARRIHDD
ncbi:MAG: protein kinase [Planctomycetes bacterium]|nr:protein kinase [Planctomycetota bacterium]